MKQVIVITGASSGFGRLTANALARAGHTVYASMRHTTGRNASAVADIEEFSRATTRSTCARSSSMSARRRRSMRRLRRSSPRKAASTS